MKKILFCLLFVALMPAMSASAAECCNCLVNGNAICLTMTKGTCRTMETDFPANPNLKGLICAPIDAENCSPTTGGIAGASIELGICNDIKDAATYGVIQQPATTSSRQEFQPIIPTTTVSVPGLTFAQELNVEGTGRNKALKVPFLNQYISAMYQYLIGVSVIAAAIMIVYGGFLYIIGGTFTTVTKGKEIITDAIIGLCLVLGIFTIVKTVNPHITEMSGLNVTIVPGEKLEISDDDFQNQQWLATIGGYLPNRDIHNILQKYPEGERPASRKLPNNPFDDRTTIPQEQLDKILTDIAQKFEVDPCTLKAIVFTESGLKQNTVGNDEDLPRVDVQSRLDFLRSGVKYSYLVDPSRGEKFDLPEPLPADCSGANRSVCEEIVRKTASIKNDDALTATPPYFGLDWRFTKGLGVGQVTILGLKNSTICPDGGIGRVISGKCFSLPVLMQWEGQLEAMVLLLKARIRGTDACAVFNAYAGGNGDPNCTGRLSKKMQAYNSCKGS